MFLLGHIFLLYNLSKEKQPIITLSYILFICLDNQFSRFYLLQQIFLT